jgi:hypothetical protein
VSAKQKPACDPYKRHKTRHPGISYRVKEDGSRTYFVTIGSRHLRVDGGEQEALLVQADLKLKKARGLRVTPLPTSFRQVAEAWFERGTARWRGSTQDGYRIALDVHILSPAHSRWSRRATNLAEQQAIGSAIANSDGGWKSRPRADAHPAAR